MSRPQRKRQLSFEMVARANLDAEKLVHSAMTLSPGEEASFLKKVETIANNFNEQQRRELAQLFIKAADQQESKIKETLRAAAQAAASGSEAGGPGAAAASMANVDFGPFLQQAQQANRAELMKKGGRRTRKRRGGYCAGANPIKKKDSDTLQRAINQNKEDICELFRIIDRLDDEREHFFGQKGGMSPFAFLVAKRAKKRREQRRRRSRRRKQRGGLKPLSSSPWSGSKSNSTSCEQACALCRVRGSGGWQGSSSKHCANCQKGGKRRKSRRKRRRRRKRGGANRCWKCGQVVTPQTVKCPNPECGVFSPGKNTGGILFGKWHQKWSEREGRPYYFLADNPKITQWIKPAGANAPPAPPPAPYSPLAPLPAPPAPPSPGAGVEYQDGNALRWLHALPSAAEKVKLRDNRKKPNYLRHGGHRRRTRRQRGGSCGCGGDGQKVGYSCNCGGTNGIMSYTPTKSGPGSDICNIGGKSYRYPKVHPYYLAPR